MEDFLWEILDFVVRLVMIALIGFAFGVSVLLAYKLIF